MHTNTHTHTHSQIYHRSKLSEFKRVSFTKNQNKKTMAMMSTLDLGLLAKKWNNTHIAMKVQSMSGPHKSPVINRNTCKSADRSWDTWFLMPSQPQDIWGKNNVVFKNNLTQSFEQILVFLTATIVNISWKLIKPMYASIHMYLTKYHFHKQMVSYHFCSFTLFWY